MNEQDWLTSPDPRRMLEFLRGKVSDRKLRLFVCACCRRLWPLLRDERSRDAVEQSERWADGSLAEDALLSALHRARRASEDAEMEVARRPKGRRSLVVYIVQFTCKAAALSVACSMMPLADARATDPVVLDEGEEAVFVAMDTAPYALAVHQTKRTRGTRFDQAHTAELTACATLLRDIIGNPFCSATLVCAWLTPTVVLLAQSIYQEKTFDFLPILADALEEAGCDNEAMLTHLRSAGPHMRGCWPLDLILGKT